MADESQDAHARGAEPAPGDIGRGTQESTTASPAEPGASRSQDFAAQQSFGDPAHRDGSPTQARDTVPSKEVPPGHAAGDAGTASPEASSPKREGYDAEGYDGPAGGLRTQETGSEEGARTPSPRAVTTTSRESLDATTKEGQE